MSDFKPVDQVLVTVYADDVTFVGPKEGVEESIRRFRHALQRFSEGLDFKSAKSQSIEFRRKVDKQKVSGVVALGWKLGLFKTPKRLDNKMLIELPSGWLKLGEVGFQLRVKKDSVRAWSIFMGRLHYYRYCNYIYQQ